MGDDLVLTGNYYDKFYYKEEPSIETITPLSFAERLTLGKQVYDKTKIKELSFVIAQMDDLIKSKIKT
jgi:hypothetical protein